MSAIINIGLITSGGAAYSPLAALAALADAGVQVLTSIVRQSDSEPTLVVELAAPLTALQLHAVAVACHQDAVAQLDANTIGTLEGPGADKWRPFNIEYFLTFEE